MKAFKGSSFWTMFRKMLWATEAQYVANYTKAAGLKRAWVRFGDRTILI